MENLTMEEKRKYVYDFRGIIILGDIAKAKNISLPLLSQIIKGDRTDTCNAIDACYVEIEKKIKAIMPKQS